MSRILDTMGRNTLYILICHTLFSSYINGFLSNYFDPAYIWHMILSLIMQLLLGTVVGEAIAYIKKQFLAKPVIV